MNHSLYGKVLSLYQTNMSGKNKKWTSEDNGNAISYKREGISLREAGKKYRVPSSTLARYLHNKPNTKNGARTQTGA